MQLNIIAETQKQYSGLFFSSFGPYVPCIAEDGSISFWAELSSQQSLIMRSKENLTLFATPPKGHQFCSHPAHNSQGDLAVYMTGSESTQLWYKKQGQIPYQITAPLADYEIGPLGPSINARGAVAFRSWNPQITNTPQGVHTVELATNQTRQEYFVQAVQGLPVVGPEGDCLYQVQTGPLRQLFLNQQSIAETHTNAGNFASINTAGEILWSWQDETGHDQLFRFQKDANSIFARTCLLKTKKRFHSIRGGLSPAQASWLIFATPSQGNYAGQLGLYLAADSAPCAEADLRCVLSLGQSFEQSVITSFALNPVSYNSQGEYAVRLALHNGKEYILKIST